MDRRVTKLNRTKNSTYQLKTYTSFMYGWSPQDPTFDKEEKLCKKVPRKFCTAVPFSQGEDWIVTYVYKVDVSSGFPKRIAYVACDYVE